MQKSVLATLLCLTILHLEVTKGQGSLPDRADEDYVTGPGEEKYYRKVNTDLYFAGDFERTPISNDWHEVSIRAMGDGSYLWENKAGVNWSLHPIRGRGDRLRVGEECPYYPEYSVAIFTEDYVTGPGEEKYYRKVNTGAYIICGEDLDTLHGLLIASSNTFDAHCCNNGKTTNNITCGNGVDCSSVCDVTPTCAKVVIEPEEGQDLCSTGDHYALAISLPCNTQSTTSCLIDAYGETTQPEPEFCTKDTYYVKTADFQRPNGACCSCKTCKLCPDCCPTYKEINDYIKGNTPSQSYLLTSSSQSSPDNINMEWKRGMPIHTICVSPGTNVTFKWDSNHNVVRIPPREWLSCSVTGLDNQNQTAPYNLNPAPFIYGGANATSFFFTSGVAGDCNAGMKAKITISNNSNCEVWKQYPGPGDPSGLVSIAAGEFGVWGLRSDDSIWRKKKASKGWTKVFGVLTYVSVGKDSVWGVILGIIWRWYDSTKWRQIPGTLKQVSVSGVDDAVVWGVKSDGSIQRWNGNSWDAVEGTMSMSMVSCGKTGVWALGVLNGGYGDIFYRTGTYGGVNSAGTGWEKVSGGLSWISTGSAGEVWGIGAGVGTLYKRQGITESKPSGDAWTHMVQPEGGKAMKQVAVFDGNVWGLITGPGPDFDSFNASAFD